MSKSDFVQLRVLYVVLDDLEPPECEGIRRKISGQVAALRELLPSGSVDLCARFGGTGRFLSDGHTYEEQLGRRLGSYRDSMAKFVVNIAKTSSYDVAYLRYSGLSDLSFLSLLRALRQSYTVLEVPTYPFRSEISEAIRRAIRSRRASRFVGLCVLAFGDVFLRQFLRRYVQRVWVYGRCPDRLWGIPTRSASNGYAVNDIRIMPHGPNSGLHMIAVTNVTRRQGLDRVIKGLGEYYLSSPVEKVYLDVVGDGSELPALQDMVSRYSLEEYVSFHGSLAGEALLAQYGKSDIGVGSLAAHRNGLDMLASLKNREYCAIGLPFFFAHVDPGFMDDFPYALRIESGEGAVDVAEIVRFWKRFESAGDYSQKMHAYAQQRLSWVSILRPLVAEAMGL